MNSILRNIFQYQIVFPDKLKKERNANIINNYLL